MSWIEVASASSTIVVAVATVALCFFNWWLLKRHDKQYELDKYFIYSPLQEKNLTLLKKHLEKVPIKVNQNNVTPLLWSYLKKGESINNMDEFPKEKLATEMESEIEQAIHLFPDKTNILKEVLIQINTLDQSIRNYERAFPTNSCKQEEQSKRNDLIGEYLKNRENLRRLLNQFISETQIKRPPV